MTFLSLQVLSDSGHPQSIGPNLLDISVQIFCQSWQFSSVQPRLVSSKKVKIVLFNLSHDIIAQKPFPATPLRSSPILSLSVYDRMNPHSSILDDGLPFGLLELFVRDRNRGTERDEPA